MVCQFMALITEPIMAPSRLDLPRPMLLMLLLNKKLLKAMVRPPEPQTAIPREMR